MFKKTAITAGLILAASATAQAQQEPVVVGDSLVDTYRWEIDAGYTAGEFSGNFDDTDFDAYNIAGSFFLDDVDTTKGPRSEAAFLDHASDVSLFYTYAEIDDNGIDVDGDTYGVSGRYVTNASSWIVEGSYARSEPLDAEIDTYTIGLGKYITDNTTLVATYWNGDVEDGGDTDGYAVGVEHFWHLSSDSGIKLEGNYGFVNVDDADDIDIYNVTGTWYVTNDLGFGATYGKFDAGAGEADRYAAFAEWFITRGIAANLSYVHDEVDDTDFETDAITLGATIRF